MTSAPSSPPRPATTGGVQLFPFAEYWWFYAGFTAFVGVLLALDLGVFHRKAHTVSIKEAALWSVVWVTLALAFNFGFYRYMLHRFAQDPRLLAIPGSTPREAAWEAALQFLAGYVVEYSLSIDNIFVFVVVLNYFTIPSEYQHRVLFFGILGALIFRAIFIAIGAALIQYQWVVMALRRLPDLHRRPDDVRQGGGRGAGGERRSSGSSAARARHPRDARAEVLRDAWTGKRTPRRCSSPCCSWR